MKSFILLHWKDTFNCPIKVSRCHSFTCHCHKFQSSDIVVVKTQREREWLYVLVMSCMHFRVNSHSIVASLVKWVFVYELSGSGFESPCSHLRKRMVWSKTRKTLQKFGKCLSSLFKEMSQRVWYNIHFF